MQTASGYSGLRQTDGTVALETWVGDDNGLSGELGTSTNHPLRFYTNDITRMTIDTNGNVGIGTMSPAGIFDVGTAALRLRIAIDDTADAFGLGISTTNGSKATLSSQTGTFHSALVLADGSATENFFGLASSVDSGTTWNPRFVVRHDGNVGIGITNPSAHFHIGTATADSQTAPTTINGSATARV